MEKAKFSFKGILQNDGWRSNVVITVNDNGYITSIDSNNKIRNTENFDGYVIPGFQNAHSHAFQYAMAGIAEVHNISHTSDNFWSWRESMCELELNVSPEQMEAIATMLCGEMVRHGYTNIAEFHYLHHDKNGKQYNNLSKIGSRLIYAVKTVGINITLVPIFYQKGGFGKAPLEGQKRFITPTIEEYLQLLEFSKNDCKEYDGANIGIGIHVMRSVEPKDIAELSKTGPRDIPFNIHISEQLKEIEDSIS